MEHRAAEFRLMPAHYRWELSGRTHQPGRLVIRNKGKNMDTCLDLEIDERQNLSAARRAAEHLTNPQAGDTSDATVMLAGMEGGDPTAAGQFLVLVYDELRRLAASELAGEAPGQTLQPTALVHEAWLNLV